MYHMLYVLERKLSQNGFVAVMCCYVLTTGREHSHASSSKVWAHRGPAEGRGDWSGRR